MEPLLKGLLPGEIRTSAATIEDHVSALLPAERPFIARAVPARQHEFATGRFLVRRLLTGLGYPDFPLVSDDKRVPVWPPGIVGSISHAASLCVVAIGHESIYRGIGLDLEPDEPAKRDIERVVCRGDEHDWVAAAGEGERGRRCRVVFSVKEAVYKAFYPHTREFWSFRDVGVSIDLEAGSYRAWLPESAGLDTIEGRVHRRQGWIVAGAAVRHDEDSKDQSAAK